MHRLLLVALSLSACATELRPLPARMDASNPDAAESPPLPRVTAFAGPTEQRPVAAPPARGPDATATPASPVPSPEAAVYTCPMHPEVQQPGPGRCPKCGMELVPMEPHGEGAHP